MLKLRHVKELGGRGGVYSFSLKPHKTGYPLQCFRQTLRYKSNDFCSFTFTNKLCAADDQTENENHIGRSTGGGEALNHSYPCLPRDDRLRSLWSPLLIHRSAFPLWPRSLAGGWLLSPYTLLSCPSRCRNPAPLHRSLALPVLRLFHFLIFALVPSLCLCFSSFYWKISPFHLGSFPCLYPSFFPFYVFWVMGCEMLSS